MELKPTIGLEIHAELKTATKMFCQCKNDTDEKRPNVNICPICLGHPGTLPVINKEALKSILKIGIALNGKLADFSEFDRKNYFYPDIPKGYQISQYKYPLVNGGSLNGIEITRVHIEEDTGKNIHSGETSLVDFNRAGVPLMELVTEPVITSSKQAVEFGQELQLLLQYLNVAHANMEKGEMRLEANVSVSNSSKLGTKVEIKNLNSFKAAEKAIDYEIQRQQKVLERGEKVLQETRGWNEAKQATYSQRGKEESHDYRYFPDPDLPKLKLSLIDEFKKEALLADLAETPHKKRERYKKTFGIKDGDINFYVVNPKFGKLFEEASATFEKKDLQTLSNFFVSDLAGLGNVSLMIKAASLADLVRMYLKGDLSSRGVKDLLPKLIGGEQDVSKLAEAEGLIQKSDEGELKTLAGKIILENEKVAKEYQAGKETNLQYLVGQAMRMSKGAANPQKIAKILKDLLINTRL